MTDERPRHVVSERKRINVDDDSELREWSELFGVTVDELIHAIEEVGDQADAVWQRLRAP